MAESLPEAMRWYHRAAEQGDQRAQFHLADAYMSEGAAQDLAEAAKWFRRAAEQGHADAQNKLGLMYRNGYGVRQDYGEAMKWYRRAAEQGDAEAQSNLGRMYSNGEGVPQDYAEAVKWYRRAAEQGHGWARISLSLMFNLGQGVPQDEAVKWYRRMADEGHTWAQDQLGWAYTFGHGVPRDDVLAYVWFNLAVARLPPGELRDQAAETRDRAAKDLSPAQLACAQRMARDWRPKVELEALGCRKFDTASEPGLMTDGASGAPVRPQFVQQHLAGLGYDPGPIDGILGPKTRAAIRAFQADFDLPVDGELSDTLRASLDRATAGARAHGELIGTASTQP